QSLVLAADGDRGHFLSDEKPTLRVRLTNLEEAPVAGSVSWQLERLGAPTKIPPQDAPVQTVLSDYPVTGGALGGGRISLDGRNPGTIGLSELVAGGCCRTREGRGPPRRDTHSTRSSLV